MSSNIKSKPIAPLFHSSIEELIQFVRSHSAFYQSLYQHLPTNVSNLEALPIVNNADYWRSSNAEPSQVMTSPLVDGLVMRSGGSTGEPKTVYMTRHEFHQASQINGVLMADGTGLISGDRIANLSSQGGLYSGFMTYGYAVMNSPLNTVNLPISGKEPLENIVRDITKFKATVIISNVFIATRLAHYLGSNNLVLDSVRLILYTGEAFYKDLRPLYRSAFPNAKIGPLAYASVECKIIAFPAHAPQDQNDDIDPLYRVCSSAVIMEIISDDGSVIREPGIRGTVVVTNLLKRLQPTIRYPVGDVAEWVDYKAGLFRLRGRDHVGLKVGTALLDLPLIRRLVGRVLGEETLDSFQTIVRREKGKNTVVFRIAGPERDNREAIRSQLEDEIVAANPNWARNRDQGFIAPIQIEWVAFKDLVFLETSGKLKEIVEERYEEPASQDSQ